MTSRTPPPPGFVQPSPTSYPTSSSSTVAAETASSSFHNLSFALGTGLAESMKNDSLTNDQHDPSLFNHHHHHHQHHSSSSTCQHDESSALPKQTLNNDNHDANKHTNNCRASAGSGSAGSGMIIGPRIHTPDTYARQSRHSVSRLVGCSTLASTNNNILSLNTSSIIVGAEGISGGGAGFGSVGGRSLLGMDYPSNNKNNNNTTNDTTITPGRMVWHHPQQQQQQQQQQQHDHKLQNNINVSHSLDRGYTNGDTDDDTDYYNHGRQQLSSLFSHHHDNRKSHESIDIFTDDNNTGINNNNNNNNNNINRNSSMRNSNSYYSNKSSMNDGGGSSNTSATTSAQFTAAIMAKNLESGSDSAGSVGADGRGKFLFGNIHEWKTSQPMASTTAPSAAAANTTTTTFTRHDQSGGGVFWGSAHNHINNNNNNNNNSIVGLTVVEPSSNRNSPALPHPPPCGTTTSVGGNSATSVGIGNTSSSTTSGGRGGSIGDTATLLGRHDKGSFYQSWQQQLQQRFMLSPSVLVVGGGGNGIGGGGGRASAPPPQSSRLLPSILTIGGRGVGGGGGGLIVGGGGGGSGSGKSTPDLVFSNKQGYINHNNNPRSSTPVVGTIVSITPVLDPAIVMMKDPDDSRLLHGHHDARTGKEVVGASSSTTVPSSTSAYTRGQNEMEMAAVRDLAPFLRGNIGGNTTSNMFNDGSGGSSVSTRGLAILHASSIRCRDVRSTCEAFGALETFRSDFGESRGVFFVTYYDLRNAQLAVAELPNILNKLRSNGVSSYSSGGGGSDGGGGDIVVKYCVPLNSSNATDESMLLLSNLPGTIDEYELSQTLSSFGEVRTIHYQANKSHGNEERETELSSYLVEFFDIQDAKQALLELEHVHPWGDAAKIEVGTRSVTKRKLGKELLLLLSSWRQGKGRGSLQNGQQPQAQGIESVGSTLSTTHTTPSPTQLDGPFTGDTASNHGSHQQPGVRAGNIYYQNNIQPLGESLQYQSQVFYQYPDLQNVTENNQQYQLVVGPDGQYSYVLMNHCPQIISPHYVHAGPAEQPLMFDPQNIHHPQQSQHHQQAMYAPDAEHNYVHNPHHHLSQISPQQYHVQYNVPTMMLQQPGLDYGFQQMIQLEAAANGSLPPTQFVRMSSNDTSSLSNNGGHLFGGTCGFSAASSGSGSHSENNSGGASGNTREEECDNNTNLLLSIDNVRTGKDRRSSLMVRNIPNKYTQQMLLSEFAAAGHGTNKMDFFYLPIDFKNKCNRGYAFVNFVNYKDIIPFVEEYNHRGWKRFNSDKVCDITYARIQGKAAMWKRFENSSLMAKDDEFRPKVFVSHGEKKGQVENIMPTSTRSGGSDV